MILLVEKAECKKAKPIFFTKIGFAFICVSA